MIREKRCPICNSKKYKSVIYTEDYGRVVEEHSFCYRCGYMVEMAYSKPIIGFCPPLRKGYKNKYSGIYYAKDIRKRKRMKRKFGIKYSVKDRILSQI